MNGPEAKADRRFWREYDEAHADDEPGCPA